MNSLWQSFLRNNNAVIENNYVSHYGIASEELKSISSNTIIADLSHFGLIHFSGEDASTFLQGLLSCDVLTIDLCTAKYGSFCTPKGRILANFLIWQSASGYLIQVPNSMLKTLEKRLSMYVLRSIVELDNVSDNQVCIGVAGNLATKTIKEIFGVIPDPLLGVINNVNESVLRLAQNRFEIITTPARAQELWKYLRKYTMPVGKLCWDWLEIKAGIPCITPLTQEKFIPQMVNLDAIGGISFKKGCYPGQEIVSRTQHLGKIKRRMYLANINTVNEESIIAGDELYSNNKQACGMIVNAAPSPEGGYDVLAVIQTDIVKTEKIYWKSLNGPLLKFISLPYLLE